MARNIIKFISIILGILFVISGTHGLYAYFYRLEVVFKGTANRLFGELVVPLESASEYITWMSEKGSQSWFIPVVFIAAGIALWWWQSQWVWRR